MKNPFQKKMLQITFLLSFILSGVMCEPVTLELYYEALCPDCQEFMTGELHNTWKVLEKTGILALDIYPYGNAHQVQQADGTWKFTCQHGDPECKANLLEACILKSVNFNASSYMPTIYCMEHSLDPITNAKECLKDNLPGIDFQSIEKCAEGLEGNQLMHLIADKTDSLEPSHTYVPWIVLNGQHTEEIQNEAQENLLGLICDTYTGPKPAECSKSYGGFYHWLRNMISKVQIEILN